MSAVVQCSCPSNTDAAKFQDKTYGQGNRVATPTAKHDKDFLDVKCTICGKVHRVHPSRNK